MKKLIMVFITFFLFSGTLIADTWWNKETRSITGKFYGARSISRPLNWGNIKNNFTLVAPPSETINDGVACDWDGSVWVLDVSEKQALTVRDESIQAFISSPFNDITLTEANDYIELNVIDLNTAKETMKKIVEFEIGLREILRDIINHKK